MKNPGLKLNLRPLLLRLAKLRFIAIILLVLILFGYATLRITDIFSVKADEAVVQEGIVKIKTESIKLDTELIKTIHEKDDIDVRNGSVGEHIDNPFRFNE